MRKLFLLGTMLGVASAAFAFGGMFSHGSKSTTYKGGVNAIGVHFGGEKKNANSEPKEATCPADKKCGDYCCGEGHTCQDGQCCDGNGHCCASSGYSTEAEACCAAEAQVFIAFNYGYGNIGTACCSGGHVMRTWEEFKDELVYSQECCPAGSPGVADYHCCAANTKILEDIQGNIHCCDAASAGWSNILNKCCEVGEALVPSLEEGGLTYCCPEGSPGYADGECCPAGSPGYSWDDGCCEAGQKILDGHCCPADSTGWGGTQPTEDPDGETHCCPNGWDEDNWECA